MAVFKLTKKLKRITVIGLKMTLLLKIVIKRTKERKRFLKDS